MKRILLLAVAALVFVGCNNAFEDEGNARFEQTTLPDLTAAFDEDTHTYVEQNPYLRWHADDRLSVFYGNTLNRQYKFTGKSGATGGEFEAVRSRNLGTGNSFDHIYAVYPYDATISLDDINKSMSLTLPAEQTYAEESFGKGANTMVAVTENLEDTFLSFKNVGGYLKVKLYSYVATVVKSITIRGNNGEKISGAATVAMTYGETPQLTMATGATGSITLDCGDGVALSADAENPTEFWVVVPPTEFSKGITISVTNAYDAVFEKSTSNNIVVERNIIQPMSAVEVEFEEVAKPANNKIWYTATSKVEPYNNVFGAVYLSSTYDPTSKKGILTFKGDVTTIGDYAFYGCGSLTSITIPDSVTTIGPSAFYGCSLTRVTIPDSVTAIGDSAFYNCSLTRVTIPDSVTTIGEEAFRGCSSLTSVTIPDSVTTIGEAAFWGCYSLTSVTIPDSVTTIGNYAFKWCDSLTSITIGNSVTTIGNSAFRECYSLTSVTIPDSVTKIGEYAFYECKKLTSVTIGDSVTTIGYSAFGFCSSLTSVTIGDSVTTIGESAFYNCDSLTSVTIPDSVTTIGNSTFYDCDSLTSVTIPDSVTTIGDGAFSDCGSLTSVTIGDSVTTIGRWAFSYCNSLTSVYCKATTPPSIDDYVFYDNAKSRKIYVPIASVNDYKSAYRWSDYADYIVGYDFEKGEVAPEGQRNNEIWYTSSDDNIVKPHTSNVFGATIVSNTYEDGKGVITFDGAVTTIGKSAFSGCSSLTSVTIPDSVTTIGDRAFNSCYRLEEFKGKFSADNGRCLIKDNTIIAYAGASGTEYTIPDSVTAIGDYAFYYCNSITSVTIGDSVTTIGRWAFQSCKSLTSVTIPDSVTTIGWGAFYSCDSLTSVTIGDSVTTIGGSAFWSCDSLTSVTIGDSVTTIEDYAFFGCNSLTSVTIGDSVTTIGNEAFEYCSSLTSVTIPDSVTTIGLSAFYSCESLTSVTIGGSVTMIERWAFLGCTSLTSVYCKATTPPSIGDYVFYDNANSRKIYVPTASVNAYKRADSWSDYADAITGFNF